MLQETRFKVEVLKPCKFFQESSLKVLFSIYQGLKATEARGSIASSIDDYLSRFMKLSFSKMFFNQSVNVCLEFIFSQP